MLQRPGSSWGFGALLKDTSVVVLKEERALVIYSPTNNPCRTWDSNPQPLDYKSDSLTIRPRLPHLFILFFKKRKEDHFEYFTILNDLNGKLKSSASLKHNKTVKMNVSRGHLNNCTCIMVSLICKRLAVSGCYKWTQRCSSSFHNRPNWLMTHSPNTFTVSEVSGMSYIVKKATCKKTKFGWLTGLSLGGCQG